MACVNEQTVQDLVLGRLQGTALDGVEHHISECSSCAALIAVAARRTGSIEARPRVALVEKPSVAVGTVVGRFVVVDFLGAGGMGEVYGAYDPNLERKVAIKFLRPELLGRSDQTTAAERMRREARLVAKLSHPNVVTVYEIDVFEDRLFIAMEYVDGHSVAEWLKAEPRAVRDIVRVFLAAGAGLAAAHAAGVIHRDFKPHNVMITKAGEVRVMDFGLAHLDTDADAAGDPAVPLASGSPSPTPESSAEREERLTRTGTLVGTPAYMAPEQFLGVKAGARTDQYSFCVAVHEALLGRRPSGPVASRGNTAKLEPLDAGPTARSVPRWIRRALRRGLATDPAQRYASMDDLLADLRADKTRRRRIALAVVAGIVLVGGGAWAAVHEQAARKVRLCRANIDAASAVWPFDAAKTGAIPPGTPTTIRDAFQRSGVADAGGIFQRVSAALSAYLEQWAQQATDACEATHVRREQSRDELALRTACLDERLSAARALTNTLTRADAKVVSHATDAALGLPDLDRCRELPLLRALRPPEGAAKQAEVAGLRRRMAEVKLLVGTGHFESVGPDLKALERDVRAVGYPPLLVDFLSFLQTDLSNTGDPREGTARVREALRVAQGAGYEEGIAYALMGLAWTDYRNPAVSDLALDQADAVVHHLGDPLVLRAWFENDVSFLNFWNGRLADSLKRAERALALKEQRRPYDAHDVALSESNICLILSTRGQARAALPHCDRAVNVITAVLGWAHPSTMNLAENRAFALIELGKFDEGCRLADRVRSFFEEAGEHVESRTALVPTLARCAVNRGRPEQVRDLLERALEAATRTGATAMETAGIEWELARNVYAGEHRRGLAIADSAAKHYATLPELAFRARDVRAWIAARRDLDR